MKRTLPTTFALVALASCSGTLGDRMLVGDFVTEYDALVASEQMGRASNTGARYRALEEKGRAIISGNPERMKAMEATNPGLYRDFQRRYQDCRKKAGDTDSMQ